MDEFGLVWLSLSLVWYSFLLFGLEDDLNENDTVRSTKRLPLRWR